MKYIVRTFIDQIDQIEEFVIGLVLMLLALIVVSGFRYGGNGRIIAMLVALTFCFIGYIEIDRRRVTQEHPEFKEMFFGEVRLFYFLLHRKVSKLVDSSPYKSISLIKRQIMSGSIATIIATLIVSTISITFLISGDNSLKR